MIGEMAKGVDLGQRVVFGGEKRLRSLAKPRSLWIVEQREEEDEAAAAAEEIIFYL